MAKQANVLYIENTRCFFSGTNVPGIITLDFPPDIISDLDVISKEKLSALLEAFIQTNGITPGTMLLALSPFVTFDMDVSDQEDATKQAAVAQKFLDTVPFQNVSSQTIKIGKKTKIIAANTDFIETFKKALQKLGFTVTLAIPVAVLAEFVPELQTNLDVNLILEKADLVKQYSFLKTQEIFHPSDKKGGSKPDNKRVFILAGVFGVLMIVLVIVIVTNLSPQKPSAPVVTPSIQPTIIPNSVSPSPIAISPTIKPSVSLQPTQRVKGVSTEKIPLYHIGIGK